MTLPLHIFSRALHLTAMICSLSTLIHASSNVIIDIRDSNTAPSTPQNLARWHQGTTLVLIENQEFQRVTMANITEFDESVFLSSNTALSCKVPEGEHTYILDFGSATSISRFFVNNQNAKGRLSLSYSNTLEPIDSNEWAALAEPIHFKNGVIPSVVFPETITRYLLIRFDIDTAGAIGNFGATGSVARKQASVFNTILENPRVK